MIIPSRSVPSLSDTGITETYTTGFDPVRLIPAVFLGFDHNSHIHYDLVKELCSSTM